jgi:hypothetical protein
MRARPETTLAQVTAAVQRIENVRVRTERIERDRGCASEKKREDKDGERWKDVEEDGPRGRPDRGRASGRPSPSITVIFFKFTRTDAPIQSGGFCFFIFFSYS